MPVLDDQFRLFLEKIKPGDCINVQFNRIELVRMELDRVITIDFAGDEVFEMDVPAIAWDVVSATRTARAFERLLIPCLEHFRQLTVVLEGIDTDVKAIVLVSALSACWFRQFRYRVHSLTP